MKGFFRRLRRRSSAGAVIVLLSMACGFGCTADRLARDVALMKKDIEFLLVVPFVDQSVMRGENEIYRCGLCGGTFKTGSVEAGADILVTEKMVRLISEESTVRLVPNDSVDDVRMQLMKDPTSTLTDLELISSIGTTLGADAVLTGSVYRWVERAGSNYAADAPASVGRDIDLVDAKTGSLLWHTRYDETQQFLIDNLLKIGTFIKRGGRWVTAEEMAEAGLKDVLESSPIP